MLVEFLLFGAGCIRFVQKLLGNTHQTKLRSEVCGFQFKSLCHVFPSAGRIIKATYSSVHFCEFHMNISIEWTPQDDLFQSICRSLEIRH